MVVCCAVGFCGPAVQCGSERVDDGDTLGAGVEVGVGDMIDGAVGGSVGGGVGLGVSEGGRGLGCLSQLQQ